MKKLKSVNKQLAGVDQATALCKKGKKLDSKDVDALCDALLDLQQLKEMK